MTPPRRRAASPKSATAPEPNTGVQPSPAPSGANSPEPAELRDIASALDSSTFSAAIRLLHGDLRTDAVALYRVLRTIDDLVDDGDPRAAERVQAIERWAEGKEAAGEEADTPETRILTDLSRRYPPAPGAMIEFCRGMREDLAHSAIETEDDLERYCAHAGGSIGVVLANMFGVRGPDGERGMACLGRAFQRTNILRDIDEDLAHGRLYVARATIERFGFPAPGAREELLREQIARADALYEEGLGAIPLLRSGRRAMGLAAALYREILRQIERDGFGRRPGRAVVPVWRTRLLAVEHRLRGGPRGSIRGVV